MATLAARLKQAMDLRGFNPYRLAKLAELDQGNVARLVRGDRLSAKHETITAIARVLRVRTEWLSEGTGVMNLESAAPPLLRDRPEWAEVLATARQLHPDLTDDELNDVGAMFDSPGVWPPLLDAPAIAALAAVQRDWKRRILARSKK